jgi:PGF-CTERM protein/PGF-pre-PGF domain-containing protein
LWLAAIVTLSILVSGVLLTGSVAAANTAGNLSLSVPTAGNQATVSVTDSDLNTDAGSAGNHVINIKSDSDGPTTTKSTSSDTPDGGSQTLSISASVYDRNHDNTIDKNDFTLQGASDESISNVALSNGNYEVTITDSGSTLTDNFKETVSYDVLTSHTTSEDTDNGQPLTTSVGPVGDRNGDGKITAADIDLVKSSDDESITSVDRQSDGTALVTITDSTSDSDSSKETFEFLQTETVLLTETGPDTGTFDGTKTLDSGSPQAGQLLTFHKNEITADYWDDGTKRTKSSIYKVVDAAATATPTQPDTGESVTFDASGSAGSISTYQWDIDDDGTYELSGSSPTHSYANAGVKTAKLQVGNGNGKKDEDTVKLVVGDNAPPTAQIQVYPLYVTKGETAYLVADGSSDDLQKGIAKYEFDVDNDNVYEKSSTSTPFVKHTFSSSGDHTVRVRVTDHAGKTDTTTSTVTVQQSATVDSTTVEHTGNGTAPSGTLNVATRNEGGMLQLHLYRGSTKSNRDLGAAGVEESTELWVNVTIDNYDPNAMMASAAVEDWFTTDASGSKTNVHIKLHPINMQRLTTVTAKSPARWPSQQKQADLAVTPGANLAMFDMPDGTPFEADLDGATLTSDAQLFQPPRYDSQKSELSYSVAAPHWKQGGSKVASNTNIGFYEAWLPSGLVSRMGISSPGALAGSYQSGGSTSSLSNMEVEETAGGGLHINVTGIHYSSGTIQLSPDQTDPTADAGSDQTITAGSKVSLDGSASSDNRQISSYEWDIDEDGTYEKTGQSPSNTYSSSGDRTVKLRVTDGNSNTDTDTVSITVEAKSSGSGGQSGSVAEVSSPSVSSQNQETSSRSTVSIEQISLEDPSISVSTNVQADNGIGVTRVNASFNMGTTVDNTMSVEAGSSPPSSVPERSDDGVIGYVSVTIDGNLNDRVTSGSFDVSLDRLGLDNVAPEDIVAERYHGGEWQTVQTQVVDESSVRVLSPGYSTFVIRQAATSTPTPRVTATPTPSDAPVTATPHQTTVEPTISVSSPTESTQTPGADGPGFGPVVAVVGLLVGVVLRRRQQVR